MTIAKCKDTIAIPYRRRNSNYSWKTRAAERETLLIDLTVGTRSSTGYLVNLFLQTESVNLGLFIPEKRKHINMLFYFFTHLSRKWSLTDGRWVARKE